MFNKNLNKIQTKMYELDDLGTKTWFENGPEHRDGDQPAIVWLDVEVNFGV